MKPIRISDEGPIRLVGTDVDFIHCMSPDANNMEVVGGLWHEFFPSLTKIPGMQMERVFGMCRLETAGERTHDDQRNYVCAAAVEEGPRVPDGMNVYEVPATTYAVFEHVGHMDDIAKTVGSIYQGWLPESDYEHSGIADVEFYGDRFDGSESSVMEYWISVRPKS